MPHPSRREFLASTVTAAGTLWSAPAFASTGRTLQDGVDSDRLASRMEAIARVGARPEGAFRTAGSDADLAARDAFTGWLEEAGFEVRTDLAGNLIGHLAGTDPSLPPLLTGSHLDSVPAGGNFDGVAGSIASLEAATAIAASGTPLRHPLEVVNFFNEENGKTGSRALAGEVTPDEMDLPVYAGLTLGQALARVGGSPERITEAALEPGHYAGFLELHIEQSPTLATEGIDIGIVEGIVGIRRFRVRVSGVANHAGTTAMGIRRDALVTAGRFLVAVHEETQAWPGRQVATVGRIEAHPGAPNVIPGAVDLTLEIRDLRMETIEALYQRFQELGRELARRNQTDITFEQYYLSRAAPCDPLFIDTLEAAAESLGVSNLRMPSGAGHDAQSIAVLAPVGMLFVPSRDGISHSPREFTSLSDIANGTRVLLESLRRLDGALG